MNGRARDDWDDRALDAALHELHGSKPPDLSARVVGALHESPPGPLPMVAATHAAPVRARWSVPALAAVLLGAAALGFVAASACWLLARPEPSSAQDGAAVLLDLDVERGPLVGDALRSAAGEPLSPASLDSGARGAFVARTGNRLRSDGPCSFRLGTFGALSAPTRMELEVQSMELTTKHGVLAASSLTLAVVAGVVTWHTLARTETAAAGEVLRMQAASDGGPAAALTAENTSLKQRVGELEQQIEKLRSQIVEREAAPRPAAPAEAKEPEAPADKPSMTFTDPAFADALAKIDWANMGNVTNEMAPLLAQLADAMKEEGAEMPMDLAVKVGALNAKLIAQLPAMMKAGLPGYGPNGIYTHPLVAANILASTLVAGGAPLTPAQQQSIDGLVNTFSRENQGIADTPHEFELERALAETEMKDRFFREVGGVLDPAQNDRIFPKSAAWDGSALFSSGLMTSTFSQGIPAKDPAEFGREAGDRVAKYLGLDDAAKAQVRTLLAQHAASPELWRDRSDAVEKSQLPMMRAGRAQTALRNQLEWMRALQQQVALTPEQKKKLASAKVVLVPLPR